MNQPVMSNNEGNLGLSLSKTQDYEVDEKQGAIHFISTNQCPIFITLETPSHMSATRTKMMMPPYILDQWSTYGVSKGLAQWTMNSHQLVYFLV
jgi:hypothetical protein